MAFGGGMFPFPFMGGDNIDQIIQHIIDNDPNKYGSPPADNAFINNLPKGNYKTLMTEEEIQRESPSCSVCIDKFEETDEELRKLPCNHVFHKDCIIPWLG